MSIQAIAKEGLAKNITSTKFIKKYDLNSASSVQSAIRLLLKNDLVTQSDGIYRVMIISLQNVKYYLLIL